MIKLFEVELGPFYLSITIEMSAATAILITAILILIGVVWFKGGLQ